jgi:hypothetical protein
VDEFELISRFFDRQLLTPGVLTGIGDDGAVLKPDPDCDQIQVIDTLVEGVHFPVDSDAADIGYRVVAVNLSDIAAMGGRPRWMTLALTLSPKDERWVADFARGLFEAAAEYDVALVGGDMTSGESVVATVHVTGEIEEGKALLRSGAQAGDTIFVTVMRLQALRFSVVVNAMTSWSGASCARARASKLAAASLGARPRRSMSPMASSETSRSYWMRAVSVVNSISNACRYPRPSVRTSMKLSDYDLL